MYRRLLDGFQDFWSSFFPAAKQVYQTHWFAPKWTRSCFIEDDLTLNVPLVELDMEALFQ